MHSENNFVRLSTGLSNSDDVLPIYIGDDRTDEDAFKVYNFCQSFHKCCFIKSLIIFSFPLDFERRKPWLRDFGIFSTQRKQSILVSSGYSRGQRLPKIPYLLERTDVCCR